MNKSSISIYLDPLNGLDYKVIDTSQFWTRSYEEVESTSQKEKVHNGVTKLYNTKSIRHLI